MRTGTHIGVGRQMIPHKEEARMSRLVRKGYLSAGIRCNVGIWVKAFTNRHAQRLRKRQCLHLHSNKPKKYEENLAGKNVSVFLELQSKCFNWVLFNSLRKKNARNASQNTFCFTGYCLSVLLPIYVTISRRCKGLNCILLYQTKVEVLTRGDSVRSNLWIPLATALTSCTIPIPPYINFSMPLVFCSRSFWPAGQLGISSAPPWS